MNRFLKLAFVIPFVLAIAACSSPRKISQGGDPQLEAQSRQALQQLFNEEATARDVVWPNARAVLVFPHAVRAGLIAGGHGGDGVMFDRNGKVMGYFRVGGASFGLQAGAQEYQEAIFLMTDTAVKELTSGAGLSLGVGPTFVVVDQGVARNLTTTTLKADVYAFVFGQEGLMAGVGLQGQRIVRFED